MRSRLVLTAGFVVVALLALAPVISAVSLFQSSEGRTVGIDYMAIYQPDGNPVDKLAGSSSASAGNLIYGGGPLETNVQVYICYWGWTSDPSGEKAYYEGFLGNVGGSTWMNVDNQYGVSNPTGILHGTWSDPTSVPSKPTQTAVNNAGLRCMQHFGYNSQADYIVATPSGHSQSGFGTRWCAYHEAVSSSSGNVAVTYFPYITDAGTSCGKNFVNAGSAGLLDGVSIVGGHEMMEAQSDPVPCSGWCDSGGSENGDKCAWSSMSTDISLGGKSYAVQPIWSNAISGCSVTG